MESDKMSVWVRLRVRVTQGHNVCENKNKRSQSMLVNGRSLSSKRCEFLISQYKVATLNDFMLAFCKRVWIERYFIRKVRLSGLKFLLGPVYIIPDSYRRAATFVSDRGTVYITPELSETRRSTNRSKNHFTS